MNSETIKMESLEHTIQNSLPNSDLTKIKEDIKDYGLATLLYGANTVASAFACIISYKEMPAFVGILPLALGYYTFLSGSETISCIKSYYKNRRIKSGLTSVNSETI